MDATETPVTDDSPTTHLDVLRASADRLRAVIAPLDDQDLQRPAYPTDWNIADVLSHIGSGATIQHRRMDDALADQATPDDFAPTVWESWNAKSVRAKADDALEADRALIEGLETLSDADRARFRLEMGPLTFDFDGFVAIRLNEHAFHTWDIEVALDPAATIPVDAAALVVDNLDLVARFTAKPTGTTRTITVDTAAPARRFTIDLAKESVTFAPGTTEADADLTLPAEAFARLVYGRLDAEHSPPLDGDRTALEELRLVYPGP
ncbi:MAG: hypothetical protein QOI95_670 [Acidimicrobiaceae bacterium]|jgi:uncharacterized protein (TIGR03083 family)